MAGQVSLRSTVEREQTNWKFITKMLLSGLLALLLAALFAFVIYHINLLWPNQPERAVLVMGIVFGLLIALLLTFYLCLRRQAANPAQLGLMALAGVGLLLVAVYLYQVSYYISFPADILTWSESDFVNDILKFRIGYPLYTAQVNNESFTYSPGAQLLTYFLAWLAGYPLSIPTYRMIQLGYSLLAAFVAGLCAYKIIKISTPNRRWEGNYLWGAVWMTILFLIATNQLTNPFVHNLHNDALAQLISVIAYWLLLQYITAPNQRLLVLMALIPVLGFLVKQSLVIWAVFYCFHLVFFDRPRSLKRVAIFAVTSCVSIGLLMLGGYLLWGENFYYWVFTVLGAHGISPLRAFQHVLAVWPYLVSGLIGGWILLRGKGLHFLLSPWLIWLVLILQEIYTSGVAWMLNHIGPGSLLAGIWFVAALTKFWPIAFRLKQGKFWTSALLSASLVLAVIFCLFSGLQIIRIPLKPLSDDAYRYVNDIERALQGPPIDRVLLDMGTWVYVPNHVIMKDRAPSIGERGYSQTGDFSGILKRLNQKYYAKILVRNFHVSDFLYDYGSWQKSSGIKQALLDNYHETGQIPAVQEESYQHQSYFFQEISILEPNAK